MATKTAIFNAAPVRQIVHIEVDGTWAGTETPTLTINGKDLVVTLDTDVLTANVAALLRDAWNANSRLDGTATLDGTSNIGGQEMGEFSEVTASIDPDDADFLVLTANRPGVPFTVTATDNSSSGTFTLTTPQAATGPEHWDNADNWDSGTVPASDDVVVFRDSDGSFKYGLPNGSLEVTINTYHSWTGQLGLPRINRSNQSKPYQEYRQRYVRLDDAGSGTTIAHTFGIGKDGSGFTLLNLKHSTLTCAVTVYNTGTPQIPGTKALNICCTANTSDITIIGGSVDFSTQDGSTSAFLTVTQSGGDSRGISGLHTSSSTLEMSGGTALIGGTAITTVTLKDGTMRMEGQTGTVATMNVHGGTMEFVSEASITALNIYGGTFDARASSGVFNVDVGKLYGGSFLDPLSRLAVGTTFTLFIDPSPTLRFGANIADGMTIVP